MCRSIQDRPFYPLSSLHVGCYSLCATLWNALETYLSPCSLRELIHRPSTISIDFDSQKASWSFGRVPQSVSPFLHAFNSRPISWRPQELANQIEQVRSRACTTSVRLAGYEACFLNISLFGGPNNLGVTQMNESIVIVLFPGFLSLFAHISPIVPHRPRYRAHQASILPFLFTRSCAKVPLFLS